MPRSPQKQKRRRGIVLSPAGWQRLQVAQQHLEAQQNGFNPFTIEQLVELTGLSHNTLTKVRSGSAPVDRQTLNTYFNCLGLTLAATDYLTPANAEASSPLALSHQDWGEAPRLKQFYGRTRELQILQQQILDEQCRLLVIVGRGGVGKTTLALKLVHQLAGFDAIVWRSLQTPVPLEDFLGDLIPVLSHQQKTGNTIRQLVACLRDARCLLVLDNVESVFEAGATGRYRAGYEAYGQLFQTLGETRHYSCLILTSRERPPELAMLDQDQAAMHLCQLEGSAEAALAIVAEKGVQGTPSQQEQLCQHYGDNPLALKIVSAAILDLFDGDIATFLAQETIIFNGIRRLFQQQFERLSPREHAVMYWLAINGTRTSIAELSRDLMGRVSVSQLLETLEFLMWRSLVEPFKGTYGLQPVVMGYLIETLVEQVAQALIKGELHRISQYALVKATANAPIRQHQRHQILEPIGQRLKMAFPTPQALDHHLLGLLGVLRQTPLAVTGYEAGNLIHLGQCLQVDLSGWDFSELMIRQADLSTTQYQGINFSGTTFDRTKFLENFGRLTRLRCLSAASTASPRQLVTSGTQGQLQFRQIPDGTLLRRIQAHRSWILAIALSMDERLIATGGEDRTIKIWEVDTGQCLQTIQVESDFVAALSFSPDGQRLAIASSIPQLLIWHLETQRLHSLDGHTVQLFTTKYSPDGTLLVSGGFDGLCFWDGHTSDLLFQITPDPADGWIYDVAFHPQGNILATASHNGVLRIWDIQQQTCLDQYQGHQGPIKTLAYSPDGSLLAAASADHRLRLWDTQSGTCVRTLQGHTDEVTALHFTDDGLVLGSCSLDQSLRLWDVPTGQGLNAIYGYSYGMSTLAWQPQALASGSADGMIRLWDPVTHECRQSLQAHNNWIWAIDWSPDGTLLASAGQDSTVKVWHWQQADHVQVWRGHRAAVTSLAWHPTGLQLATGGMDVSIRLWTVASGVCPTVLMGNPGWVLALAWSPDGNYLASAGTVGVICIWDMQSHDCIQQFMGHRGCVLSLDWHPKGTSLLSTGSDGLIQHWDVNTAQNLQTYQGHDNPVTGARFDRSGQVLLSSGHDQTVRLWDVESGACQQILRGHAHRVFVALFSPETEDRIASSSEDGTLRLWDRASGECHAILQPKQPYDGFNIEGANGLTPAEVETLKSFGANT